MILIQADEILQEFLQKSDIDYDEIYSLVMDVITFRFLIILTVKKNLDVQIMDVVTAYLYGNLDKHIYMKIPEGFYLLDSKSNRSRGFYLLSHKDHSMS